MKALSYKLENGEIIDEVNPQGEAYDESDLVLCFGNKGLLKDEAVLNKIKQTHPKANIVLSSTAGEIFGDVAMDHSVIVNALCFQHTTIQVNMLNISQATTSYGAGKSLIEKFNCTGLKHILVFSDGSLINGSELVNGMRSCCEGKLLITGGLAGDDANFNSTVVGLNEAPKEGNIVAIGFYGNRLHVGHGSSGGWETFGIERMVTRSKDNVVYEIDGKNALELYKTYLGKYSDELPGSALLFPLAVKLPGTDEVLVRTILNVSNVDSSMTFAGDIKEGSKVRFMKANLDKLVDAAYQAAENAMVDLNNNKPVFALLISCVGRKLIFGSRIDEEIEAVRNVFGENAILSGFYSYGEICPTNGLNQCQLHNQTMTITTFFEE